ncbi:MAG: SpoIIE family protein phosphatase [Deltaproteobacteria bacterium]|jgi:sigma-B regulation protein RsbU (phosphoserine phosphatase)|nr:SpoIIE family protein phosphatase [Deltaproteobacteria bacterium]
MSRPLALSDLNTPRVKVILILIIVASLYAIYGVSVIRWRNSPDFGWRAMYDSGPNIVAQVLDIGEKAGLHAGDTIQAINGKPYHTFEELFFDVRHKEPGSVNTYTVEREGQTLEISVTTSRIGLLPVLERSGPLLLIGLVYVFIGVIIFLMKPKAPESLLFLIMTGLLGMEISFASPSAPVRPLWFFNIRVFVDVFLSASIIHLAIKFPKERKFLKKFPWLWSIPHLLAVALYFSILFSSPSMRDMQDVFRQFINIYLMLAVFIFLVLMIWNFLTDTSVLIRRQSQVIFLGMLIGIFPTVADLIVRALWKIYLFPDPAVGSVIFLSFFPLSIGYTIVKHDLFAIDAVIKRTYGYILTTGSIAGMYGVFVLISNLAFGRFQITQSPLFPLIFILAVVFFFNPVRNRVQKIIDRVFYRLEYDYRDTVQKISEAMRTLLNLDQIGKSIMDIIMGVLYVDAGCVMLLNKKQGVYECLTTVGERETVNAGAEPGNSLSSLPVDSPFIEKIITKKKEVTVYDIQANPFFEDQRESCQKIFDQLGATLIVPLIYEDQLTGFISLGHKKSGKFYRSEDMNLLNTLANQGAVAIENARMIEEVIEKERMEEELSIGRDLQMSMLPAECPTIDGFEIAAHSVQAREVGGDFYDFIEMEEEKLGMVIGDVTGKSVSGALVMSASRSVLRMLAEEDFSVGEVMTRANRRIKKDGKIGMFVALLYAVLNPREKTLGLCSAGQTQPVYISADTGEAVLVQPEGDTFPLGILDDVDYQETHIQMAAGDRIVLYTDGIVEAMNEQEEMFGFERLLEVFKGTESMTAESLLQKIISRVDEFAGKAAQHDDLTIIVVGVKKD